MWTNKISGHKAAAIPALFPSLVAVCRADLPGYGYPGAGALRGQTAWTVWAARATDPGGSAGPEPPVSPILPPIPPVTPGEPQQLPQRVRVLVRQVRIVGNTVLPMEKLSEVTQRYVNRELATEDLEALRLKLTRLYIDAGYINSGAIIPDQKVSEGVVSRCR